TDGVLDISSVRHPGADDPEIAAIEIVPTGSSQGPPSTPTVTAKTPAAGATGVGLATTVSATFSLPMDATTMTSSTFTLPAAGSSTPIAATVSYDAATKTATLTPTLPAILAGGTSYTARLETTIKAADGIALAAPVTWSFSTSACPCRLFTDSATPALLPAATGGWEVGVKIKVDQPMLLTAL